MEGVERRVPEMRRMVEFNCTSTRLVWAQRDQTGAQYSAAEQQSARADDRRVLALAPQVEPASFINKLFRFFSLPAVFVKCSLYGLESPQDRLGGTHAEGAGHPDKLTVHGWRWYNAGGTHCWLFWRRLVYNKSPLSTEVWHPRHIWRETAFQFAEVLALNGETYVVSVNDFRPRVTGRSLEYKLNRTYWVAWSMKLRVHVPIRRFSSPTSLDGFW